MIPLCDGSVTSIDRVLDSTTSTGEKGRERKGRKGREGKMEEEREGTRREGKRKEWMGVNGSGQEERGGRGGK